MRFVCVFLAAVFVGLVATAMPLAAQKRIALIVGIDAYPNLTERDQLRKAVNDSQAVADTMRDNGFTVMHKTNIGRLQFIRMWSRFLNQLEPGDVAALYFSGHGVEIDGQNYLIPGDVPKFESGEREVLKASAISLNNLLSELQRKKTGVNLVILDACRDNPFASGGTRDLGGSRGLARLDSRPGSGTFVMYSAGLNERALDRLPNDSDPNSVYTRKLLPLLRTKGLSLQQIAIRVRTQVRNLAKTVSHNQNPAYYDQMNGEFFLAGKGPGPGHGGGTGGNEGSGNGSNPGRADVEATLAFAEARRLNTAAAYLEFLRHYPHAREASRARNLYRNLTETQAWKEARTANSLAGYNRYLIEFPNGQFRLQAKAAIDSLRAQLEQDTNTWSEARRRHDLSGYREYLRRFPNGQFALDARRQINLLQQEDNRQKQDADAWALARQSHTVFAYNNYLRRFPNGRFSGQARRQLSELQEQDRQRRDQQAWSSARQADTISAYQNYIRQFPGGQFVSTARSQIRRLQVPNDPLQVYQGYDAYGGDYRTIKNVTYNHCYSSCNSDQRCKAFTFNTNAQWCFLKATVGELRKESVAIAGVRSSQVRNIRVSKFRILRNRDVRSQDYASREGISLSQCRDICAGDSRCRSFAFITRLRSCWLKTGNSPIRKKRGVVLGVKQ